MNLNATILGQAIAFILFVLFCFVLFCFVLYEVCMASNYGGD
uniref:ATP synthase subunit b n=1 Tax=Arsenophonus endosymbiont of Trialeurodes vaporariorum TaxID=235567 RepID=A0A3B0LZ12_9GAMM